jgi:hypothetical protein
MLAKELDGLPLALATAGAYLDQASISVSGYLRLYKESWAKLQKTSPEVSSYEDRTLYSIWQISYNRVEQRNRLSAKLLHLWAYFDNQDLWFELLRHGDSEDPDWIRELTKDELNFHSSSLRRCDLWSASSSTPSTMVQYHQEGLEGRGTCCTATAYQPTGLTELWIRLIIIKKLHCK